MTIQYSREFLMGTHIRNAIYQTILEAQNNDCTIRFDFNQTQVLVNADSNPELIYRDWDRATQGCIQGPVGPYPAAELSQEELDQYKIVQDRNEAQAQARRAQWDEEAKCKRNEAILLLSTCPEFEYSENGRQNFQIGWDAQKGQRYGTVCYDLALNWGRLLQKELSEGREISDPDRFYHIADDALPDGGTTGFQYGCVKSVLKHCWKHGDLVDNFA